MKEQGETSNSNMYLVQLPIGDWDMYYKNVFVTYNRLVAEEYVNKYNKILEKYKTFIEERFNKEVPETFMDTESMTQRQINISLRHFDLNRRHPAIITKIKII